MISTDDIESMLTMGGGLTTRKNTETCYLGRRGKPARLAKDVREIILAPVREHSRKPDEVYDRIRYYCAGPYLELFAREVRDGWDSWGDEIGIHVNGRCIVGPWADQQQMK